MADKKLSELPEKTTELDDNDYFEITDSLDGQSKKILANKVGKKEYSDSTFRVIDDGDNTKKVAFEASNISTGTTRTINIPDQDVTLVDNTLNNLGTTAINTDLLPGTDLTHNLGSNSKSWYQAYFYNYEIQDSSGFRLGNLYAGNTNNLFLSSNDHFDIFTEQESYPGDVWLYTGNSSGTSGQSGGISIFTGDGVGTNSNTDDIFIFTGEPTGNGYKGYIDIQGVRFYQFSATTTDATPLDIWTKDTFSNTTTFITIKVLGHNPVDNLSDYHEKKFLVKNTAGTGSIVGTEQNLDIAEGTTSIAVSIVNTDDVKLTITGVAAQTWNWTVNINFEQSIQA